MMNRSQTHLADLAIATAVATTSVVSCVVDPIPDTAPESGPDASPVTPATAPYLQWAREIGGVQNDVVDDVVFLADGSSVVAGHFSGTVVIDAGGPAETTLIATAATDMFVARYDHAGTLVWAKKAGGSSHAGPAHITAYPDGSSLITGSFLATMEFGAGESSRTQFRSAGDVDAFVARYNADGSLAWARRVGGTGRDIAESASIAHDGAVLVTGDFSGAVVFGATEPGEVELSTGPDSDAFIARFRGDGTLAWASQAGRGRTAASSVAAFPDGSSVLAGSFKGIAIFGVGQANETELTSAGGYDLFLANYDPAGTLRWVRRAGGSFDVTKHSVAVLPDGASVVAGQFRGVVNFAVGELEQTTLTPLGEHDIYVARYSSTGTLSQLIHAGGPGGESVLSVAPLADGSLALTGTFTLSTNTGTADLGPTFGIGEADATILAPLGPQNTSFISCKQARSGSVRWQSTLGYVRYRVAPSSSV